MSSLRSWLCFVAATLPLAIAGTAAAQAPLPEDLPWGQPVAAMDSAAAQLGLAADSAAGDEAVYATDGDGVHTELRARFGDAGLWHAFYFVQGDSASVQAAIDRSAAAATERIGAPQPADDGGRVWTLPDCRAFALPAAPTRLEDGRFGYAVVYTAR
jgi:hypothetical protein